MAAGFGTLMETSDWARHALLTGRVSKCALGVHRNISKRALDTGLASDAKEGSTPDLVFRHQKCMNMFMSHDLFASPSAPAAELKIATSP